MDAETFKEIFLPYHPKLYRVAYRMVEDTAGAEDIVQDTFVKLWNKRNGMEHVNNTESFALTTLRNTCLDYLRTKKNSYHTGFEADIPETTSLPDQLELNDDARYVKTLIDGLPEQQRLVMMLKHWEGYSDYEIEEMTGLSRGNIRVVLSRARKTIREQYSKIERK